MVAYSFHKRFVLAIERGWKRQTIRAPRKRHARPGEAVQLYTGMRSKSCRFIRNDVVCTRIDEVRFDLRALDGVAEPRHFSKLKEVVDRLAPALSINGIPLDDPSARHMFAMADGFGSLYDAPDRPVRASAFAHMVLFWMAKHGPRLFEGVMVSWEPRP